MIPLCDPLIIKGLLVPHAPSALTAKMLTEMTKVVLQKLTMFLERLIVR